MLFVNICLISTPICDFFSDIELVVGTKVQGVVLHMSTNSEHGTCLELSCDKSLVRMVSRRSQLRMLEEARHGQKIKAKVLLVKDDFVLLVLKQHALGALALMPRKLVCIFFILCGYVFASLCVF